jgi:hypothetical protein
MNAVRQLASSADTINAADALNRPLLDLQHLLKANASNIYPLRVQWKMRKSFSHIHGKLIGGSTRLLSKKKDEDASQDEPFVAELQDLSARLTRLADCIYGLSDIRLQKLDECIRNFADDVAVCLVLLRVASSTYTLCSTGLTA